MKLVEYEHHGTMVKVQDELKGKHREYCLCFSQNCKRLKIGQPDNCPIAQALYKNCVEFNVVTPVWECPYVEPGEEE
jgi:hypothetical protein